MQTVSVYDLIFYIPSINQSIDGINHISLASCIAKTDFSSIDFAFNRFFVKLSGTNNIVTVKVSQSFLVYLFQALCCAVGQTSLNRNLIFVWS